LVRRVLYGPAEANMSTYDRLVRRHRSALRIEKAFVVTIAIIASATMQIVF
jgi:hypothetical protein